MDTGRETSSIGRSRFWVRLNKRTSMCSRTKEASALLTCFLLVCSGSRLAAGEIRYTVIPLENPINTNLTFTQANGISDSGFVTGYAQIHGQHIPFLFHPSIGLTILGAWPRDYYNTRGHAVNNLGQVTGYSGTGNPKKDKMFRFTLADGFQDLGNLGDPRGDMSANAINEAGTVVGNSQLRNGDLHAFRYTDAEGMIDLGTLGGTYSAAGGINDFGWISGTSSTSNGVWHAFLYHDDTGMMDLGPGFGVAINNAGIISGTDGPYMVFLQRDGRRVVIRSSEEIYAIYGMNDASIFVGITGKGAIVGSEAEGIQNLNTLIAPDSGWYLSLASDINNYGQIAGQGQIRQGETWRDVAVRLDPIPPKMQIRAASTNVIISWTPAWPDVALETSDRPDAPDWNTIPNNNTNIVTVPISAPQSYFRLTKRRLPSALD